MACCLSRFWQLIWKPVTGTVSDKQHIHGRPGHHLEHVGSHHKREERDQAGYGSSNRSTKNAANITRADGVGINEESQTRAPLVTTLAPSTQSIKVTYIEIIYCYRFPESPFSHPEYLTYLFKTYHAKEARKQYD